MDHFSVLAEAVVTNWPVWFVTVTLIVAAVIDGFELKVPNWVTFPLIISGWVYSAVFANTQDMPWWHGLGWSALGTVVGLGLLLPAYAVGGMGAGDVKLLAGVGAWMHTTHTIYAFAVSAVVGAALAVLMVLYHRAWRKHSNQFWVILTEILTIRSPTELSTIAAERKSSMLLLPYGIPIAMGTIGYFVWNNMLV
jgi:prepilin peptidase CpaA